VNKIVVGKGDQPVQLPASPRRAPRVARMRGLTAVACLVACIAACRRAERPGTSESATAPPARPGPDAVAAVCDSVEAPWRLTARAQVRRLDTTSTVLADSLPRTGCVVMADAPRGLDSLQWQTLYWKWQQPRGWAELTEYMADGPDGGSRTLERAGVRCQIGATRNGGDDSDSTYVPSPEVTERTFCWRPAAGS